MTIVSRFTIPLTYCMSSVREHVLLTIFENWNFTQFLDFKYVFPISRTFITITKGLHSEN